MLKKTALVSLLVVAASAQAFPWYANGGFRGAELMSREEQQAYVAKLQAMKTLSECEAYMGVHETELEKRALAAKTTLSPVRGDPCQIMLRLGRIQNR